MQKLYCFLILVGLILGLGTSGCKRKSSQTKKNNKEGEEKEKTNTFKVNHQVVINLPQKGKQARIWMVLPKKDSAQEVKDLQIVTKPQVNHEIKEDPATGNRYLYVEVEKPQGKKLELTTNFNLTRKELKKTVEADKTRPLSDSEKEKFSPFLKASTYVVINDKIRKTSQKIVGQEENPLKVAKKIYDWILENVDYWVKDPENKKASGRGDSMYCLANKTGNCTDFHALYTSLIRAQNIPARIIYGSLFKEPLAGKDQDQSYHCWVEFYAPEIGWIPLDVAVADIFVGDFKINEKNEMKVKLTTATGYEKANPNMVQYYFGNLEARRVSWTVGRDLKLVPSQSAGPVSALPKAYVEVDGQPYEKWTRKLTYEEVK